MSVKYITCLYTCDQKNIELVYLTRLSDQKSEEIGRNFRLGRQSVQDAGLGAQAFSFELTDEKAIDRRQIGRAQTDAIADDQLMLE